MAEPDFTLEMSQNRYLSTEDSAMDAVLTVTAGNIEVRGASGAAAAILLDCSDSMSYPPSKINAARRAAAAAVDALPEGTFFAVIQGRHDAEMCYPRRPDMAVADGKTKADAKAWIDGVPASGGTAMGTWLTLARELFQGRPAALRHAVLLTDGRNEHETPEELDRVLNECDGHFFCDARGIGDGWDPHELQRIVTRLRGTADSVRVESELVDDFRALAGSVREKVVPDLLVRVTTMQGAELRQLKQVHPRELDYTGNPARPPETVGGRTVWEFSTGAWAANDSRDFQLCLRVDRGSRDPMSEDLQVAMIELVVRPAGAEVAADRCGPPAPVLVHWTADATLSSRFDPKVAHYGGQAELNRAVLAGFDAYDAGDLERAVRAWGTAVRLATESGNTPVLTRLERLVDVVDAGRGIVRIKPNLSRLDVLNAAVGSNISSRAPVRAVPDSGSGAGRPDVTCPKCGRTLPGTARFCQCGTRLTEQSR